MYGVRVRIRLWCRGGSTMSRGRHRKPRSQGPYRARHRKHSPEVRFARHLARTEPVTIQFVRSTDKPDPYAAEIAAGAEISDYLLEAVVDGKDTADDLADSLRVPDCGDRCPTCHPWLRSEDGTP